MAKIYFNKVTILGVGLIGASFALALKKKRLCGKITGYGRKESNLRKAKKLKIIDSFELDAARACRDSDLVLFSIPVGSFTGTAEKIQTVFLEQFYQAYEVAFRPGPAREVELPFFRLMPYPGDIRAESV